jgi:toxin CcdB
MRQYDVCRNLNSASRKEAPFLLILQADLLQDLRTVVIAPIRTERLATKMSRLNPAVNISGKTYRVSVSELTSVLRNQLGEVILNTSEQHSEFVDAIDLIFTGV